MYDEGDGTRYINNDGSRAWCLGRFGYNPKQS